MQDIINSFKAHLYDRTSSPIVGAFIFYWLVCNYKMIVVLLDERLDTELKFKAIDELYKNDFISIFNLLDVSITGFILPTIITLVYVLLFPFISNFIYKGWVWHQNKLKEISNGQVMTKKEFGELQKRFIELELSFNDTFSKKDNEIIQLKQMLNDEKETNQNLNKNINEFVEKEKLYEESIDNLDKKLKTDNMEAKKALLENIGLKKELENLQIATKLYFPNSDDLDDQSISILKHLGENPNNTTTEVAEKFDLHRLRLESIYDNLVEKEFIKLQESYTGGDKTYRIEPLGRKFLIENNLI